MPCQDYWSPGIKVAWPGRRPRAHQAGPILGPRPARRSGVYGRSRGQPGPTTPGTPAGPHSSTGIQAECPASRVARWTPPRPASCAAWVRHEKPSARYTASGCADRDGSRECDATATDRS